MSRVAANAACRKSTTFSLNLLFRYFSINMKSFKSISSGQVKKYFHLSRDCLKHDLDETQDTIWNALGSDWRRFQTMIGTLLSTSALKRSKSILTASNLYVIVHHSQKE